MSNVAGARWQSAAQLHLTLCFIGNVSGERQTAIVAALRDLRFAQFKLSLSGIGVFGSAFSLYEDRPTSYGSIYNVVGQYFVR